MRSRLFNCVVQSASAGFWFAALPVDLTDRAWNWVAVGAACLVLSVVLAVREYRFLRRTVAATERVVARLWPGEAGQQ